MYNGRYRNLTELAQAMELCVSQVCRVREDKRGINEKFLIGAKRAFSDSNLDDLFYLDSRPKYGRMMETTVQSNNYYSKNQYIQSGSAST